MAVKRGKPIGYRILNERNNSFLETPRCSKLPSPSTYPGCPRFPRLRAAAAQPTCDDPSFMMRSLLFCRRWLRKSGSTAPKDLTRPALGV